MSIKRSSFAKKSLLALTLVASVIMLMVCFEPALAQPPVSIYDIQYTTDPSGDSPYADDTVTTEGIVTAIFYNGFFIQDPAGGPWSGLFVNDTTPVTPGLGVSLTGTVVEYYGLTQLTYLTAGYPVSIGNPLPDPVILPTGAVSQEQWEGVLVRTESVTVTNSDLGYGEWSVNDGSGDVVIDDKGSYIYTPADGDLIGAVIGPLDFSYGAFKILPRDDDDILGIDACPDDPDKTETGICGCGVPDEDTDTDSVADCIDNCVETPNPLQLDFDGDWLGDVCDLDDDNDGILDDFDECLLSDSYGLDADRDGCIDTIGDFSEVVGGFDLHKGTKKSFLKKIKNASSSFSAGKTKKGLNKLHALNNQVEALRGKKVSQEDADILTEYIENLERSLGGGATWVFCEELPATEEVCDVTTGSTALLIKGDILGTDAIYQGGEVLVDETGLILFVGCSADRPADFDGIIEESTRIQCAEGTVSPGLINSHDHLYYNHNNPFQKTKERYNHRNDWRSDPTVTAPGDFDQEQVAWSELRQAMVGTTSIAGAGGEIGFLRNLDMGFNPISDDSLWDIFSGETPLFIDSETFPLEDPGDYIQNEGVCSGWPTLDDGYPNGYFGDTDIYVPHVAEGINLAAQNEFACLSSTDREGVDVVDSGFAMIHGVALNALDGETLASEDASLIWSPRSNISLYGNTAQVSMLDSQGVNISLSTDWTPSGSMNLGRELVCAETLNRKYFNNAFSDRDLWRMATYNAAVTFGVDDRIGSLKAGFFGDIAIYDGRAKVNPYRAVIEADAQSTVLVLRRSSLPFQLLFEESIYVGSIALYGDAPVLAALPPTLHEIVAEMPLCEPLEVCTTEKIVCPLRETWWTMFDPSLGSPMSLDYLSSANTDSYPLFFCEEPPDEPTCNPLRIGEYAGTIGLDDPLQDRDGDGIIDIDDNCPSVFNPIRPMDEGSQPDIDGDGIGDACDEFPLVAGTL